MNSSEVFPRTAVRSPTLESLLSAPGPFVAVYIATEPQLVNVAQRNEQRWKALRTELVAAGAPSDLLDNVGRVIADAPLIGKSLAVIATADGVLHVEHHGEPPRHESARWAPLPSLVPLIEWRQSSPPYILVLTDRQGADLTGVRRAKPDLAESAGGVDGPLTKSAPGGWSQRQYQRRAENTWEQNAGDVADKLVALADEIDPRLILVAGDVRAVQLLKAALPENLRALIREVEGGRAVDGSQDATIRDSRRWVADAVARDDVAILERFREEHGQQDQAADGAAATITALNQSRVAVLLVHDDLADDRTCWFGPGAIPIATTREELETMGIENPSEGRLIDAAVRAALGTGAGVRVVPRHGPVSEGLGALLRWG